MDKLVFKVGKNDYVLARYRDSRFYQLLPIHLSRAMGMLNDNLDSNKEEFIIKGANTGFIPEPKGIGYAFFHYMLRNRNLIAQIDSSTGVQDTYNNLLQRCIRTALAMRSRGITPGDVITICSFNHVNACVPLIASFFLGAKPACLDPTLSHSDTVHLLKQVKPKMAFVGPEACDLVEKAAAEAEGDVEIVVFGASEKHSPFTDFFTTKIHADFFPVEAKDNKETAMIFFSSGTTGMPKGICLSHRAIIGQAYTFTYQGFAIDVCLIFASFYWISATFILTACVLGGGCRLIVPRFDAAAFWKLIHEHKVTTAFTAPSQAMAIYKIGRPEGINTAHFVDYVIGGGPISAEHIKEIREILPGTNCSIVYGQTEVAGLAIAFDRNSRRHILWMHQKPGSTGTIAPDLTCKIVDPDTEKLLGPHQNGELRIKTNNQMNGYYDLDSSDAWDSEGWLKTGDVAYYDEDRCFYIVDRIKEMLKFQSFHVPPAVIEAVLMTHPNVQSAAVIGLPDDVDGDHPLGIVTLKDPESPADPEEIEKYVESRVDDRHRLRGGVKILDTLPFTATGKVRKHDLRNMVLQNLI